MEDGLGVSNVHCTTGWRLGVGELGVDLGAGELRVVELGIDILGIVSELGINWIDLGGGELSINLVHLREGRLGLGELGIDWIDV